MKVAGWITWGIVTALALYFIFCIRMSFVMGHPFTIAITVETFLLFISSILFLIFKWNKLHLLWILPVIFLGTNLILTIPIISHILIFLTNIFMKIILIGTRPPMDF